MLLDGEGGSSLRSRGRSGFELFVVLVVGKNALKGDGRKRIG